MANQKSIIDLFEDNELKVSILYKLYSQKIPGHKKFWESLSQEEVGHAESISQSFSQSKKNLFTETKFSRGVIKYVNDFVEEKIEEAKKKKISHLEAVNVALRIEQSILENKCFDLFIPNNATVKEVLKKLNKDTIKHKNVLLKELKKKK